MIKKKIGKGRGTRLTFIQACEIRKLENEGWTKEDLAKRFDVTVCSVCNVCSFRSHKYA